MATKDLYLEYLDVKTAFLHSDLEDIYMMQPHGYIMPGKGAVGLEAQEESLRLETGSEAVISEVR